MGDSRSLRTLPSTRRLGLLRLGAAEGGGTLELWLVEVAPAEAAAARSKGVPSPSLASNASGRAEAPRDGVVRRALELMQSDLKRRWTVASLAKAVGVSRAAFARRFNAALGVSPIAHLTALRLARAAQRLLEADAGMAELAGEVGYDSEFAFSRAFKRAFGLPPATFRRRQRAPAERVAPDGVQPEAELPQLRSHVVAPRCLALAA